MSNVAAAVDDGGTPAKTTSDKASSSINIRSTSSDVCQSATHAQVEQRQQEVMKEEEEAEGMEAAGSRGPEDRIQEAARRTQRLDKYFLLAASLMLAFCAYKWQHTSDELYVAKHTVTQLSQAKHLLSKHLETLERSTEQSRA